MNDLTPVFDISFEQKRLDGAFHQSNSSKVSHVLKANVKVLNNANKNRETKFHQSNLIY